MIGPSRVLVPSVTARVSVWRVCRDGFRTLVVSALGPAEYEAQLADAIPLGYMQPLFLMPP